MKKTCKVLALLLALAMLLSMVGCGQGTAPSGSASAPENGGAESSSGEEALTEIPLPISEEKITLTYWWPQASDLAELTSPNDGEYVQALEEKTGIHIEWIVPADGSEKDAYNLLFASDDMPDIVQQSLSEKMVYRNGMDAAIEDGFFVDLNEYKNYAPNYFAFMEEHPDWNKNSLTDSGKRYGMYRVYDTPLVTESGLAVRQDFLDKLGMDRPVTYDDWYEMLKGFKSLGCSTPLYLMANGATTQNEMSAGYGVAQSFYQEDGVVKYGPIEEGWKEYLTMMNKWYSEGLFDQDFMARTGSSTSVDTELLYNDNIGAFVTWTTRCDNNYVQRGAQNPDFMLVGVTPPVKNEGDVPHLRGDDLLTSYVCSFSATSEHLKEAIMWQDYRYEYDNAQDAQYGLDDGRSFNYDESGKRILSYDFRYSNPEGVSSSAFFAKYAFKDPPRTFPEFQWDIFLPLQDESMKAWGSTPYDWNMPANITLTADEGNTFATITADITTYVDECNVKFITGSMSLDEFDSFVETIKGMGIDEAIAIQQAALDRYNAR